jgi:FAD/FMN-containing dehydrogenase
VSSPAAALTLLSRAREALGETVSAFELIHRQGLEFLEEVLPHVRRPFAEAPEWCVLVDLGLARGQDAEAALAALFEAGLEEGLVSDGLIAQSQGQAAEFWNVREHLPAANRMIGSVSSHDVSVPLGALPDFIARAWEVVTAMGDFRINCFGHVGDGNLHFNVFPARGRHKQDYASQRETVQQAVHDLIHALGGSVSAEHGIGRMKVDDLERYGDPVKLSAMRAIKDVFDPNGIMNPGAVLRMR